MTDELALPALPISKSVSRIKITEMGLLEYMRLWTALTTNQNVSRPSLWAFNSMCGYTGSDSKEQGKCNQKTLKYTNYDFKLWRIKFKIIYFPTNSYMLHI